MYIISTKDSVVASSSVVGAVFSVSQFQVGAEPFVVVAHQPGRSVVVVDQRSRSLGHLVLVVDHQGRLTSHR